MFMESDKPADTPIAQGAYWIFAPLAVLLAIPPLTGLVQYLIEIPLGPAYAEALDLYRIHIQGPAHEAVTATLAAVTPGWTASEWLDHAYVLSFAGGLHIAAIMSSGAARRFGPFAGFAAMLALAAALGATFLGFAVLYIVADGGFIFDTQDRDDRATMIPLVIPPLAAVAFLIAGAWN